MNVNKCAPFFTDRAALQTKQCLSSYIVNLNFDIITYVTNVDRSDNISHYVH